MCAMHANCSALSCNEVICTLPLQIVAVVYSTCRFARLRLHKDCLYSQHSQSIETAAKACTLAELMDSLLHGTSRNNTEHVPATLVQTACRSFSLLQPSPSIRYNHCSHIHPHVQVWDLLMMSHVRLYESQVSSVVSDASRC